MDAKVMNYASAPRPWRTDGKRCDPFEFILSGHDVYRAYEER